MTTAPTTTPKPRRRWYQYSLRSLLVLVLIGAILVYLAVWIPGLPGPYHEAYLAWASLHNIRARLLDYEVANGHLPLAARTSASW